MYDSEQVVELKKPDEKPLLVLVDCDGGEEPPGRGRSVTVEAEFVLTMDESDAVSDVDEEVASVPILLPVVEFVNVKDDEGVFDKLPAV